MNPTEFCYWLRGFLEMAEPKDMNEAQMEMLKKHLDLVFVDVTHEKSVEAPKQLITDSPPGKKIEDAFRTLPDLLCSMPRFC